MDGLRSRVRVRSRAGVRVRVRVMVMRSGLGEGLGLYTKRTLEGTDCATRLHRLDTSNTTQFNYYPGSSTQFMCTITEIGLFSRGPTFQMLRIAISKHAWGWWRQECG